MNCFSFQPMKQGAAHQRGLSPLPANSTAKQLSHLPFLYVMCRDSVQRDNLPRTGPCASPSHPPALRSVPAKAKKPVPAACSFAVAPHCWMLRGCCSRSWSPHCGRCSCSLPGLCRGQRRLERGEAELLGL